MDHFCILFLREKDGGQCPQPDCAGYRWGKLRCGAISNKNAGVAAASQAKLKARFADRRSAAKSRIKPRARLPAPA